MLPQHVKFPQFDSKMRVEFDSFVYFDSFSYLQVVYQNIIICGHNTGTLQYSSIEIIFTR